MSKHLKSSGQNKKRRKKIVITLVTLVLLAAAVTGTVYYLQYRNDQKTVEVMPVQYCAVTDYWGDQTSSSGTILSDYTQELFPTADKIITDIFVTEGQEVHIGDPLLQYDKTRLELDVEQKDLDVKKAELSVEEAQSQLKKLQNTTPAATTGPGVTSKPTQRPSTPTPTPTATAKPSIPPADVTLYSRLDVDSEPYTGSGTSDDPYVFLCTDGCIMTKEFLCRLLGLELEDDPDGDSSYEELESPLTSPFAAVFEVREGNSNYGDVVSSFKLDGTQFSGTIKAVLPAEIIEMDTIEALILDATPTPSPTANPNNYNNMGYTSAQLKQLIAEKQTEIRDLQYQLKLAKLNLEIAQRALENSTVLSNVDGRVRSLIDLDAALAENKPFMVVAGDEKYYISGALNESLLGSVNVGDIITAMSWMNGMSYTAQIVSISEYPMESSDYYYSGSYNPNTSNYEFTAVIEEDDLSLENGMYVEITMDVHDGGDSQSLYLEKPYLREDDAGFYVMKAGTDNRLVKQYVQTGKTIYGGGYLEVQSGLSIDDFIAFPYGVDTKEGVRVVLQGGEGELPYPDLEGKSGSGSALEPESSASDDDYGDLDLPEGAVVTGQDENGLYVDTDDEGGIILD